MWKALEKKRLKTLHPSLPSTDPALTLPVNPVVRNGIPLVWVIVVGLIVASSAAILIRITQSYQVPSNVIVAFRLGLACVLLTPWISGAQWQQLRSLHGREMLLATLNSVVLAIHFLMFVTAFESTPVIEAMIFSSLTPFFAAILATVVLKETVNRSVWLGIVLAFCGTLIIAQTRANPSLTVYPNHWFGNSLAMLSSISLAINFTLARHLRHKLQVLPYSWLVFGLASVWVGLYVLLTGGTFLGYPRPAYGWLFLIAVLPQIVGHGAWNYALGKVSPTFISLLMMLIPLGSTVLAWFIFGERPLLLTAVGGLVVMSGVAVANLARRA